MTQPDFAFRPGRIEIAVPVEVAFGQSVSVATLTNIGRGGLFVATEGRHDVGDRVSLTFRLPPDERGLTVHAEVRWRRESEGHASGLGLRFVDLPIGAAIAIQEFLRQADEDLTPSWPST